MSRLTDRAEIVMSRKEPVYDVAKYCRKHVLEAEMVRLLHELGCNVHSNWRKLR